MISITNPYGVGSRFLADDSLTILIMHRVGLVTTTKNPVKSSLQNNCTILGVKFRPTKKLTVWAVPNLNLTDLSLLLININAGPVVFSPFSAAISTIPKGELVLPRLFIDSNKVVVVVELVNCWEVSVLLVFVWPLRFWVSVTKELVKLVLYDASEDLLWQFAHLTRSL